MVQETQEACWFALRFEVDDKSRLRGSQQWLSNHQASNGRACELFAQSVMPLIHDTRLGAP